MRKAGDSSSGSDVISGQAGDQLALECVAEGGNPAPSLAWRVRGQELRPQEAQEDTRRPDGRWRSVSRLRLPVSSEDNGARVECLVTHDAVEAVAFEVLAGIGAVGAVGFMCFFLSVSL